MTTASSSSWDRARAAERLATNWRKKASKSSCWKRASASNTRISSTTNGRASPSLHGRICARPPAAGGFTNFPNLPAWIVKSVGGTTTHWAGASLRFQEHEFKEASTYGHVPDANLLDWPITLADLELYYAKAEDKMRVTRTGDRPGLPGSNNFKVFEAGAKKLRYKEVHTGRMAINSTPGDGRVACHQTGFCFQGGKWGAKWSTLYTEIPKGEATGNMEVRPDSHVAQIEHDFLR